MALTSPGLIKAMNDAIVAAGPACNIAREFASDFSDAFQEPGLTVKVPVADAGTIESFADAADYEHNTGSVTYATLALNTHKKATFEFKGLDLLEAPNAPYWATVALAAGKAVGRGISSAIGGLFTTTGCTGGKAVLSSVTLANIAALRDACLGDVADTVLGLDGANYTSLMAVLGSNYAGGAEAIAGRIPALFGFKSVTRLSGLPNGVTGALIPADSVAIAGRAVTCDDPSVYAEFGTVTDPASGLTLTVRRHTSAKTGKAYINVEALFGAALIQPTKIKYLAAS